MLFFAVGVAVLLVAVNTSLRFGAGGRAALYAISAFATASAVGTYVVARYVGEEFVVLFRAPRPKGPPSTSEYAGTCSNVCKRSSGFPRS